MANRTKLQALVREAKEKVRTSWRTGLLPFAAHGAGVSGITDVTYNKLRSVAATLVGARSHASIAAWFSTQTDSQCGPVFDATTNLVVRYASMAWGRVVSLA
eukprot:6703155-Pyramimonas_sp.AAC.1